VKVEPTGTVHTYTVLHKNLEGACDHGHGATGRNRWGSGSLPGWRKT
jgi:hypothetical protein